MFVAMTDTTEDDGTEDVGVDLRPNGGLHVWLDEKKLRVRPVRFREYRDFMELWRDLGDKLNGLSEEAQEFSAGLQPKIEAGELLTAEDREKDRDLGRRINDMAEQNAIEWWTVVLGRMCDHVVDEDTAPAWLGDPRAVTDVLNHWGTRPSRSGGR